MIHLKKTIIALILLNLGLIFHAYAQTPGFEQDDIIKIANQTTDAQISSLPLTGKLTSRAFVDGLGRTIQTVAVMASPTQKDVIQPVAYDPAGRQVRAYLPYASSAGSGVYRPAAITTEQPAFYNNGTTGKVVDDTSPFSQQVFDNSPLQRLLQAGSAGALFQPGTHASAINYTTNTVADNVIEWATDGTYTSTYMAGELSVIDAIDADGKETKTFTDLVGHTVLKRQLANQIVNSVSETYFDTYYIYNSGGELVYTIPPKALALMVHNSNYSISQAGVNKLIFAYKYDTMGRLIKKTIPGSADLYIVYDPLNRPVLMQDGNLRAGNQWNYVKYDAKGRAVSQGIYTDASHTTLASMQAYVSGGTVGYNTYMYEYRTSASPYYTNTVFPTTSLEPLAYSIFDDYDLNMDGVADYAYSSQGLTVESAQTTHTRNMLTVTMKRSLGSGLSNIWLTSVIFYDKHGNVIQVKSNNQLNTATTLTDTKTSVPDFTGKTLQTLVIKVSGNATVTNKVLTTMNYDAASGNRLVSVDQTYNSQSAIRIAAYAYNEAGQLVTKQLGNTSGTTGTTYLQNVDFRYNIHGQLTSINNSTLTNDSGTLNTNGDTNDLFGMQIMYELPDANLGTVVPSYTGNISAVKWMSKNLAGTNTNERSFKYTYDKLNRFAGDSYAERTGGSGSFSLDTGYFSESNVHYDENGNIISLNRKASGIAIDQLAYAYDTPNPNHLTTVTDGTGSSYTGAGFRNVTGSSLAYGYATNGNGNLVTDNYKGLTIGYNELNKTDKITITTASGRYIYYTYDASGNLIRKQAYDGGMVQTTTDYVDGFVYVNGTISYLPMPEGRVMNVGGTFKPEYIIADQQGNARFSFQNSGTGTVQIVQENSYYASGLIMPNSPVNMPTTPNKQLYNGGSEWQNDYSNLPDYYQTFNRNYDAALGRFISVDPDPESAESMTTYQYAGNNPLADNDPMGNRFVQAAYKPLDIASLAERGGGGGSPLDDDPTDAKLAAENAAFAARAAATQSKNSGMNLSDEMDAINGILNDKSNLYGGNISGGGTVKFSETEEVAVSDVYTHTDFTVNGGTMQGEIAVSASGISFPKGWGDQKNLGSANQGVFYPDGSAFFKNETQAYNYMWQNSNYGKSNTIENFAYVTKNGVAVLPTHGNGYQNTANSAYWYQAYKTRGQGSTFAVDFNGTWIYPIASIHTHPDSGYGANESPDGGDMAAFRSMGIPGFVLGPNNFYGAGMSDLRSNSYNTYPAQNLLNGSILIIPNIGLFK